MVGGGQIKYKENLTFRPLRGNTPLILCQNSGISPPKKLRRQRDRTLSFQVMIPELKSGRSSSLAQSSSNPTLFEIPWTPSICRPVHSYLSSHSICPFLYPLRFAPISATRSKFPLSFDCPPLATCKVQTSHSICDLSRGNAKTLDLLSWSSPLCTTASEKKSESIRMKKRADGDSMHHMC